MSASPSVDQDPPAPRRRARRGEGDRTREEILVVAEDLLARSGSEEAVSIRAVAEAVGVTAPSIYRHFPDKAHLIFEVCSRRFEVLDREVVAPILAVEHDPVAALISIARGYARFGVANPEHYRIMFMGRADHTPELYADANLLATGSLASIIGVVQQGIDEGRLRADLDPVLTTFLLWTSLHGVVSMAITKPDFPAPEFERQIDGLVDALLHGIVAEPPT